MICPYCGKKIREDWKHCPYCEKKIQYIESEEETPAVETPAQPVITAQQKQAPNHIESEPGEEA